MSWRYLEVSGFGLESVMGGAMGSRYGKAQIEIRMADHLERKEREDISMRTLVIVGEQLVKIKTERCMWKKE